MKNVEKGIWTRKLIAAAVLTPALLVVGCSDDDYEPESPEPTTTISGEAYDGYLADARVCVDENLNKACDGGEPTTTTDAGDFTIEGLNATQARLPLVLEATPSTTDLDTGNSVSPSLRYTAPGGAKVISGFSTNIQSLVETELHPPGGMTRNQVGEAKHNQHMGALI